MSRPRYPVTVCILEPHKCPHDPDFEHDNYYGCVPRDFSTTTGKSKTKRQSKVGERWWWNGGCDAVRLPSEEDAK